MKHRWLETLQNELAPLQEVHQKETAENLVFAGIALWIVMYQGFITWVPMMAGLLIILGVVNTLLPRLTPKNPKDISLGLILFNIAHQTFVTLVYSAPALVLAQSPSTAMLVVTMVWVFGVFVHILNFFARFPAFNMINIVPVTGMAALALWIASGANHRASSQQDWMIAAGAFVVFMLHTFAVLRLNMITARKIEHARRTAQMRTRQLKKLSQKDTLTDLLNRSAFDTQLRGVLGDQRRAAVFLIDLDGFKPINDSYSHLAGDTVLIETARRLRHWGGPTALAARMGGDEFVVAIPGLDDPVLAQDLANELRDNLAATVFWQGKALQVTASIGVALSSSDSNVETLCAEADQAMFRAKADPIHGPVLFDMVDFAPRLSLEDRQELVRAIGAHEFRPHYQPKVDMASGRVVGFEALARWYHPIEGCSPSAKFMEQIDELSLHGDFLMSFGREVLTDLRRWIGLGFAPGQVSINLAEANLATRPAARETIAMFAEFEDVLDHVTLEITEDVFLARSNGAVVHTIERLREMGVRISLDDFGTGYASLQHLRSMAVDEIKIDVSFVNDLGSQEGTAVLIDGILDIAEGLGLEVIAEGVETEAQAKTLIAMGCRRAQGFYWSAAVPEAEAPGLLRTALPRPARLHAVNDQTTRLSNLG